jgi:hypothetical protein
MAAPSKIRRREWERYGPHSLKLANTKPRAPVKKEEEPVFPGRVLAWEARVSGLQNML